jgi:tellurite resistance protein TehA-like permease
MYDISPADIVPFVAAVVAAFAAMLFNRHRGDARPYSLVAAILYAIALGCVLLGLISWGMRLMH